MSLKRRLFCYFLAIQTVYGGTVSDIIDYQLYKDFAMNKGQFKVGATNVVVERKDGSFKVINLPIPDFASTDSNAVGTLIDPNYVAGVKHNKGYTTVKYGYNTGHTYKLIDRNEKSNRDYHTPRLNKVVTDVAPTKYKQDDTLEQDWKNKYSMFARVGSGIQYTQKENGDKIYEAYAYEYLTGGIITSDMLYKGIWINDRGPNMNNYLDKSPLPIYIEQGDSGSPLWGFNNETQEWELVAFGMAISDKVSIYIPVDKAFMEQVMKEDYLPEIEDIKTDGEIVWNGIKEEDGKNQGIGTIVQGNNKWDYNGLKSELNLANASNDELNFTKHVTFAGEGGTIKLADSINMGAGKLTFKNNYIVKGETGNETWVGAGIEIDKDKEVIWQVNGVEGDALHKIGEGTLHVNGTGINKGALNVGDGIVVLDQQEDINGEKQAFEYIDIVSGRATVVLKDSEQIDTSKINFLFRGGRLDVHGNEITFGKINAVDSGAMIVNHTDKKSTINIDTDKFIGDSSIYHGQFGEKDEEKINGEMDVNIGGKNNKTFAITGGSNLNGDFNLTSSGTTLILSGERDLHAGEKIKETTVNGDYYFSEFTFKNINMAQGSNFYGSVYSVINGDVKTEGENNVVLGYISDETKIVYDSTQETKEQNAVETTLSDKVSGDRFKNITTFYTGNLDIKNNSNLKMGYTQLKGDINLENSDGYFSNSIVTGNVSQKGSNSIIENTTLVGNLNLSGLSNSTLTNSSINGDINLSNSNLKLVDSVLNGTIGTIDGELNLLSTIWNISGDSQVNTLLLGNNTKINFKKNPFEKSAEEFSTLTVGDFYGNATINFNTDSKTGKSDKVIINNLAEDNLKLTIDFNDKAEVPDFGNSFSLMEIQASENKQLEIVGNDGSNVVDIGSVKTELKVNKDENDKMDISVYIPSEIDKRTAGSTTNAMLSEYAARMELIKSQRNLVKDSMLAMDGENFQEGFSYRGNYSESNYESNKFREYNQNIINHGVSYENMEYLNNMNYYKGISFIYGKSNIDYDGNYSGNMETYSANVYGKFLRNDGYFIKGNLGFNYVKDEIDSESFNTGIFNFGSGIGISKKVNDLKLTTGIDFNMYYIPGVDYQLRFKDKVQKASIDDEFILEINPEVRIEKEFENNTPIKVNSYGVLAYELNQNLSGKSLEVTTVEKQVQTALIEKGASLKVGTDLQYENIGVSAELKYYMGEYGAEKLTGTIKGSYKF
ncbi:S6 family peptidase [Fusobacterium perfoetens]|uniref:S6 family peptidase n=1 Tax=Fusobacterium perfoetens TaxID=852 RepID=UPI000484C311|nr:S6 family peptidase [Fusobacterium perfoetens]